MEFSFPLPSHLSIYYYNNHHHHQPRLSCHRLSLREEKKIKTKSHFSKREKYSNTSLNAGVTFLKIERPLSGILL